MANGIKSIKFILPAGKYTGTVGGWEIKLDEWPQLVIESSIGVRGTGIPVIVTVDESGEATWETS